MSNVHFKVLGCRLNQAEAERMAQGFRMAGHAVVDNPDDADILIVNTCTVTKNAGDKSRRAARAARSGQKVVVTGCHSQVRPRDFSDADLVVSNEDKSRLVNLTLEHFGMDGLALGMDYHPSGKVPVYPLTLGNTRAFVKIQDGCNLRCTFCMTTIARGASHSLPADQIVAEVRGLAAQGCQEVVLTGVHAGSYLDAQTTDLGALITRILLETDIPRLRLSSLEPWNFRPHWTELWKRFGSRMCRHLHMSLQSGADSVLKRMARAYDANAYRTKVRDLRQHIPDLGVTTDIIVGFPGETDEEHRESMCFVREMRFSGAHIFTFSSRPGTEAAAMTHQISRDVRQSRFREMREITDASARNFGLTMVGRIVPVLWEEHVPGVGLTGLSDNYLRVYTHKDSACRNSVQRVRLEREMDDGWWAVPEEVPQNAVPSCVGA